MYKNNFLLGFGTFAFFYVLRKPLKKAAIITLSSALTLGDKTREAIENIKEETEDIIAEAKYENMRKKFKVVK